jgi:dihydrofolate synthase / folylpolyglutamate synthase
MLPLFGAHQLDNAVLALAAVQGLLGAAFDAIDDDVLRQGFLAVTSPGRLEIVHRDPTVILDGAHNPHGARTVAAALTEAFDFRSLVLVIACLDDKDVEGIVGAFADVANHVVVTVAPSTRSASLDRMRRAAEQVFAGTGVVVEAADDVAGALELATGVAGDGDAVVVSGSLYTVGAAREVYLPVTDSGDDVVYEPDDLDHEDDEAFQRAIDEMIDRVEEERGGEPPTD